jgi:hypothetical protein
MTDERIEIWNLFHDGEITAISDEPSEALTLFVSVPYLRRRLRPLGDSFVVSLSGVTLCEFQYFGGEVCHLRQALEVGAPEILSTESEEMPITIATTLGNLRLSFRAMRLALDTGEAVAYESIARASDSYWAEWKARSTDAQRR